MSSGGFNLHTIGVILMVVGVIGLFISLLWMTIWSRRRDRVVYDDAAPASRRPPESYGSY